MEQGISLSQQNPPSILLLWVNFYFSKYIWELYYVANPINLLIRINVAKTTFTEYITQKFAAIPCARQGPHINASSPRVTLDPKAGSLGVVGGLNSIG